jgi:hypothetical protein
MNSEDVFALSRANRAPEKKTYLLWRLSPGDWSHSRSKIVAAKITIEKQYSCPRSSRVKIKPPQPFRW